MNSQLRFGVAAVQIGVTWEEMGERWRYLEELGFDSVWLADGFVWYRDTKAPWFEAWTLLAALAVQTSRIRIGTLVTAIPFRNPAFLARQAMTVDHISNGRLELGLGAGVTGGGDPSYRTAGIEDFAPRERVARFREAVEIIDSLLRDEVSTFEGLYYQTKDAVIEPQPVQRPRPSITIAAAGPAMLKVAARHADAWNTLWEPGRSAAEMEEVIRQRSRILDDQCAAEGRDPSTVRRSLAVYHHELDTAYDSVDAFEDDVGRFSDVGIDEFILNFPLREDQLPIFERIARDAIPRLRG